MINQASESRSQSTESLSAKSRSESASSWTLERSRQLYGVKRWGLDYFGVGADGFVSVTVPTSSGQKTVSMQDVIAGLADRELSMPVMLRIENLISDRVVKLNEGFRDAISTSGYNGVYKSVFPIKVNQQKHVVDSIAAAGDPFQHGFEAGSKPELMVALATTPSPESLIVCNGYKDEEFLDLGLQARRLGYQIFFVIESLAELALIIRKAKKWNVEPLVGCRIKLSTKVDGHWADDSGDRSLFGLTARETIAAVDMLKQADMLKCLQMLHFHLGSQLTNIRNVRDGVREACRYYIGLVDVGAPMGYLDLGGGLAVDYDGTFSTQPYSRNYDLNEYCVDVVESVMNSMDQHQIPHPVLVSESGRWTVAPTSVLLFNVLSVTDFEPMPIESEADQEFCQPIGDLFDAMENLHVRRVQENFNDANYYRDQLRELFRSGRIQLRELAFGENLYLSILNRIAFEILPQLSRVPAELTSLHDQLADIYYGNFSVFQSLPDAWAIEQIFPTMPIHRLDEEPTRTAIIADLTCDCDGKLDRFTDEVGEPSRTLKLHPLKNDQPYYLGVFLVGAYQETLGDLHNLFGDTNVASISIDDDGKVQFVEEIHGDSISNVLSYVEYQPQELIQRFRSRAEAAFSQGSISATERQEMLRLYRESMQGYTYFEV
ncbi:biosynthetic arginine decarboxylase [Mariniblastus fucicola]|uniref:Arginine decarboxylase n=1 Tax=Mariniblastus fucicola TaxID=980251 RepID=A0A5B9P7F1_9BACT|nr:biosynthetic arginine decarboxylase [Mariniblastus fucicola]QEG20880.1 Biosynthetic arginine decarboxylase [Mariniblastus fucicola]